MNHAQRKVLNTTCMSHGLIHVYELSVPALLLLIQAEFGSGDLQMGTVVNGLALLFGLGALPAGWLVDRFGSRPLLLVCLWGSSLSMLGMAASPSLVWFALAAAMLGLCLSIYHPAGTALITHAMAPSGRVFAWHGMAGNTGVAGASLLAGTLGALFGWRWAVALLAALGLMLGMRAITMPSPSLHEIRARPGRGHWPTFVLLLVATAFMGMVYRGMTTFLPKFFAVSFSDDASVGTAVGGILTTAALLAGLAGMYVAGRLVDLGRHPALVFLAGALLQAPFLVLIGYAAGPVVLPLFMSVGAILQGPFLVLIGWVAGPVFIPLFMSVAFFHFFTQPAGNHLVADFTPPRLRGLGYGIYFLMTFGAGSIGASVGGWVSEEVGLKYAFPALAILLLPSTVAVIVLSLSTRGRDERGAEGAGSVGL